MKKGLSVLSIACAAFGGFVLGYYYENIKNKINCVLDLTKDKEDLLETKYCSLNNSERGCNEDSTR